jgi:hypothetical protein
MNILIIRAFIKLREMLATHKDLARKVEELERQQKVNGSQLAAVYSMVKRLIEIPTKSPKPNKITARMLAKEPAARYAGMRELSMAATWRPQVIPSEEDGAGNSFLI